MFFATVLLVLGASAAAPADDDERAIREARAIRLKVLARDSRDANDRRRLAAWEELLAHGDDGIAILEPIVAAKLAKDRAALTERFKGQDLARARKKIEDALIERRDAALACIFDRARYPEEDHGAAGQPEVDRLVALVSTVYDHPAAFTREAIPDVEILVAALEEDVVYLETCGGTLPSDLPSVHEWLDGFDAGFEIERLGISDSQHHWNVAVMKHHAETLLTSADPEELACMNATNAYRMRMGVRLLELDERLVRAARKHSLEMKELGYFSHGSPNPENRDFGTRCAREGHRGANGENIAWGVDGTGAFWSWYSSSGHHRNILGGHQQLGVGRAVGETGGLFTQCFGSGDSLRGRAIDDPQILYLARLARLDPTSAESEFEIARWCRAQEAPELEARAVEHAQRCLALDPAHTKALEFLAPKKPSR